MARTITARSRPLRSRSHAIVPSQVSHQAPGRRALPVELLAQRPGDALALAGHLHNLRTPSVDVLLQPVDLGLVARLGLLLVLVRPAQHDAKIGDLGVLGPDTLHSNAFVDHNAVFGAGYLDLEPADSSYLVS